MKYRVIVMILMLVWFGFLSIFRDYRVIVVSVFVLFLLGILSFVMGIRYLQVAVSSLSKLQIGEGYIAGVAQNGGINISYARAGGGAIGMKESGAGSWSLFFMMLWNEIRLDNYYPIIQYRKEVDGELLSATLCYGAFQGTWKAGEKMKIAWNEKEPELVIPLKRTWLKNKSAIYVAVGILLWGLAFAVSCLL